MNDAELRTAILVRLGEAGGHVAILENLLGRGPGACGRSLLAEALADLATVAQRLEALRGRLEAARKQNRPPQA